MDEQQPVAHSPPSAHGVEQRGPTPAQFTHTSPLLHGPQLEAQATMLGAHAPLPSVSEPQQPDAQSSPVLHEALHAVPPAAPQFTQRAPVAQVPQLDVEGRAQIASLLHTSPSDSSQS